MKTRLRRTFRAHVVERGAQGQWEFSHAQMRLTVARRNLKEAEKLRRLHGTIADHLESLPREDPLHETETMVHLIGAGDRVRAAAWQRDLWVSRWKMAHVLEQTGRGEARRWWRRAHEILDGMNRAGMHLSPADQGHLKWLEEKTRA